MANRHWIFGIVMAASLLITASAHAQIKTLIMPGEVIEGHADIEQDCDKCHQKFARGKQRVLCLDCHDDVADDIKAHTGFHGLFDKAREDPCASCHTDHEGRNADIVHLNRNSFDHTLTDYPLLGEHKKAKCASCHESGKKYREAPSGCADCHTDDDVHKGSLGATCGDCHAPTGWKDVTFDHDDTGYPLIGKHLQTACLDCHADQTFQDTPTDCYSCHAKDDAHNGKSGQQCGDCHSPTGWKDTLFDHARDTRFPLEGKHADLTCGDCHSEDPFADQLEIACVSCHQDDDKHKGHFGGTCESCHASDAWDHIIFNHDTDTDYALHGAHKAIECEACHVEPIYEVALNTGCNDCHEDDDPHKGTQGTACQECHSETDWKQDVLFDHGLTGFPLLGAHKEAACEDCHETKVYQDAPSACVDCHRDDDPHEGRFDNGCAACHNPVDWKQWRFDHDTQTDFPLLGAHATVACNDCHRQPLSAHAKLGDRCGDCHRADDVHDGEFGFDCGRCHSPDSFTDVRVIQ